MVIGHYALTHELDWKWFFLLWNVQTWSYTWAVGKYNGWLLYMRRDICFSAVYMRRGEWINIEPDTSKWFWGVASTGCTQPSERRGWSCTNVHFHWVDMKWVHIMLCHAVSFAGSSFYRIWSGGGLWIVELGGSLIQPGWKTIPRQVVWFLDYWFPDWHVGEPDY